MASSSLELTCFSSYTRFFIMFFSQTVPMMKIVHPDLMNLQRRHSQLPNSNPPKVQVREEIKNKQLKKNIDHTREISFVIELLEAMASLVRFR